MSNYIVARGRIESGLSVVAEVTHTGLTARIAIEKVAKDLAPLMSISEKMTITFEWSKEK